MVNIMSELTTLVAQSINSKPVGIPMGSGNEAAAVEGIAFNHEGYIAIDIELAGRFRELNLDYQVMVRRICRTVAEFNGNLVSTAEVELLDRSLSMVVDIYILAQNNVIIMPTDAEVLELIRWGVASLRVGEAHVVTTICPDYWYDEDWATGDITFTMDGLDVGIGYIGEGVIRGYQAVLPVLVKHLGIPVYWHPMYAGFEASIPTPNETAGETGTKAQKIAQSAAACAAEIGMSIGISPYCYGLTLEQYDVLKNQLTTGIFELRRSEELDGGTDGRDWAMVALLNPNPNILLLEGTAAPAGRKMYDAAAQHLGVSKARMFLNTRYS